MIAIDTGILIWGVRQNPAEDRERLIERCRKLIADHDKVPIMIPSVALAEYLTGMAESQRQKSLDIISRNFTIRSFGTHAAEIAAKLYCRTTVGNLIQQCGAGRQCLKADIKIIATAVAEGATVLYSEDDHFTTLAAGTIIVKKVPPDSKPLLSHLP